MTAEKPRRRLVLDHLSQLRTVDGILLIIGCDQVIERGRRRFEIRIQGNSEIGVYDVALKDESGLAARIDEMIDIFVAAYKLRADSSF